MVIFPVRYQHWLIFAALSMVIFLVRYQHSFMFASFVDGYLSCPLPTLVHVCFIYRWLSFLPVTNTGSCLLHLSMVIFPVRYQHWFMFASFIDGYLSSPLPTLVHVCFIYRWLSFLSVTNTGSCLLHLSMVIFPVRYQHWFMFALFIDGYLSCPLPTLVHVCFIYRWLSFLPVTNTGSWFEQ
mgnify:CR=1 FL=1